MIKLEIAQKCILSILQTESDKINMVYFTRSLIEKNKIMIVFSIFDLKMLFLIKKSASKL